MKKVVILGGGYAGSAIAQKLDQSGVVEVVLIDDREVMVHKISGLRSAVNPKWQDMTFVSRDQLFRKPGNKFLQGKVKNIGESSVTLQDGTTVDFDFLVCATGARNSSPGEPKEGLTSKADLKAFHHDIAEALGKHKKVVIIGGGVVGVEFSGEIKDQFPESDVTIIHSGKTFVSSSVPPLPKSFHPKIAKQMDKRGIEYLLEARAEIDLSLFKNKAFLDNVSSVKTNTGEEVPADLVFLCVGTKLNNSIYPQTFLAENGKIRVNRFLQVEGKSNVFAAGDIASTNENDMAYFAASGHAPVVAANIINLAKGKTVRKSYKPMGKPFMIVPLGRNGGAMANPFGTLGSTTASMIKGKSLFVDMAWKSNNLKTPKLPPLK